MHGGSKAVGGGVTETDGVFLGLEFGNGANGAKDLFLHDLHIFGDVGEDGRLDVITLLAVAVTTNLDFRALLLACINVAGHIVSTCAIGKSS